MKKPVLFLLICLCSRGFAQGVNGKPPAEFYRLFRCQELPVQASTKAGAERYFVSTPAVSYSLSGERLANNSTNGYPVFKATGPKHAVAEARINQLIRQCLTVPVTADAAAEWMLRYEIVVSNDSFFSIDFISRVCGNQCSTYTTSFNYDLIHHQQMTNCMLLAQFGAADRQFEKDPRTRWSKLTILDYGKKVPYVPGGSCPERGGGWRRSSGPQPLHQRPV